MQQSTSTANWSELIGDLLERISCLLSLQDYYRFGAVCQNWNSMAKQTKHPSLQSPWLVLGEDRATQKREFFILSENKHYLIDIPELRGQRVCGSSHGWLFTLDMKLNFRLVNPLTRKCFNLPRPPPFKVCRQDLTWKEIQLHSVFKAILDRDPSRSSDFTVLILYGDGCSLLACWKPNDAGWKLVQGRVGVVHDIVCCKEKFYAVQLARFSIEIDLVDTGSDPKIKQVVPLIKYDGSFLYLVDYAGELLLVQRKSPRLIKECVVIQKIDIEKYNHYEYKPIDGPTVFMGSNSCLTVDTSKYTGCKRNVFYLTATPIIIPDRFGCEDLWIYDPIKNSVSQYYNSRPINIFFGCAVWFKPNLC